MEKSRDTASTLFTLRSIVEDFSHEVLRERERSPICLKKFTTVATPTIVACMSNDSPEKMGFIAVIIWWCYGVNNLALLSPAETRKDFFCEI